MARIGFIGLGHMGFPMANNLIQAGHQVTGFDLQPAVNSAFKASGGHIAASLQAIALQQDAVITMLQTGEQVKSVCLGDSGLFNYATPGTLFIDCSSIDVASSRQFHEQGHAKQLSTVDAPVSGGVSGAKAASLTFMMGGTLESVERAKPILACMGKKLIHTGHAGSGQAAKICNNMILGISMIGISEAFILAEHLGLSPQKLHEVVNNASGQCWAMSHYAPVPNVMDNVPANHNYQAGFTAAMMLKDLKLSQECATKVDVKTPMGQQAMQLYHQLLEQGKGDLDFSAIIQLLAKL